jgi:hypothetical protein
MTKHQETLQWAGSRRKFAAFIFFDCTYGRPNGWFMIKLKKLVPLEASTMNASFLCLLHLMNWSFVIHTNKGMLMKEDVF